MQKQQTIFSIQKKTQEECTISTTCGGCTTYDLSLEERIKQKKQPILHFLLQQDLQLPVSITHVGFWALRDRFDLQYQNNVFGLYAFGTKNIVPMKRCPKVHPLLNKTLSWLYENPLPISKASLRIRRSSTGLLGIWIDTSNKNIHSLLQEENWLTQASEHFVLEMGQKNKRLIRKADKWGLQKHPVLESWFETPINPDQSVRLYTPIGGFTQPSMRINREMVLSVQRLVQKISTSHWLEYGCGAGTFSFMLSQHALVLDLIEVSTIAQKGLQKGLSHLNTHATIQFVDSCLDSSCSAILVDPPRSGMGRNIVDICQHPTLKDIIYVSCHVQSLIADIKILSQHGFRLQHIHGINQFPRTAHCEWIAHLHRIPHIVTKSETI